jgi:nicotinamidase-related amidase
MSNTKPNSSKLKVLVVVDVQNCFIAGGSYGGHEKNSIDGDKLANSISQII